MTTRNTSILKALREILVHKIQEIGFLNGRAPPGGRGEERRSSAATHQNHSSASSSLNFGFTQTHKPTHLRIKHHANNANNATVCARVCVCVFPISYIYTYIYNMCVCVRMRVDFRFGNINLKCPEFAAANIPSCRFLNRNAVPRAWI